MEHTKHFTGYGIYFRFPTDEGTVWARVKVRDEESGELYIYEQDCALAAVGLTDAEAHIPELVEPAQNRFGTGTILGIVRTVFGSFPKGFRLMYERKTGANPDRLHERLC